MTTSDFHFVLTLFFMCLGCFVSLNMLFVLYRRHRHRKGS
jgi:hypothetical protein